MFIEPSRTSGRGRWTMGKTKEKWADRAKGQKEEKEDIKTQESTVGQKGGKGDTTKEVCDISPHPPHHHPFHSFVEKRGWVWNKYF